MEKTGFCWTARLFENGKPVRAKYFFSEKERNEFVADNPGWKKRGKICAGNLEKHLWQDGQGEDTP